MNRFTKFAAACVGILCLALTSCLDTREEVWIRPDGSGSARINVSLPAAAAAIHGGEEGVTKLIEKFVADTPAITTHLLSTQIEADRLDVDLTITFSNALDFLEETSGPAAEKMPAAGAEMIGTAEIDFKGLDLVFSRTVELSKAIPGAIFIPQRQLDGHTVTTIIHLPAAATTHNATSTADGDHTLIWETSLAEAIRKPKVSHFTMPLPIPWGSICFIALLLLILLTALIYYLRRRKRAKAA